MALILRRGVMSEESWRAPDHLFEVRFPITFASAAGAVALGLTGAYYAVTYSLPQSAIFLGAAATAAGTVTTAYFTARTLQTMMRQERERRRREDDLDAFGKRERSLRYGERWNNPSMYYVRDVCRGILERASEVDISDATHGRETNVIHLLNFFEEVGYAIDHELADETLLRHQFSGLIPTVWRTLEPWVRSRRARLNDDRMWEKAERLAQRWRATS